MKLPALDEWIARAFDTIARNPIRWALVLVGASVFVVGGIFSLIESGVSYPDGMWWAFVSMTTVGYGDIAPKTPEIRFMALFVIASGIVATLILGGALTGRITQRRLMLAEQTPQLDDDVDELIERLETLKRRIVADEAHENGVAHAATTFVVAYREHHDVHPGCVHALARLEHHLAVRPDTDRR